MVFLWDVLVLFGRGPLQMFSSVPMRVVGGVICTRIGVLTAGKQAINRKVSGVTKVWCPNHIRKLQQDAHSGDASFLSGQLNKSEFMLLDRVSRISHCVNIFTLTITITITTTR